MPKALFIKTSEYDVDQNRFIPIGKAKISDIKIYGYVLSCPRIPSGRYFKALPDAMKEMNRMMRHSSQCGIREVYKKEWETQLKKRR